MVEISDGEILSDREEELVRNSEDAHNLGPRRFSILSVLSSSYPQGKKGRIGCDLRQWGKLKEASRIPAVFERFC